MDKKLKISVSTDPAKDVQELYKTVKEIENTADYLHFDIMDGVFVQRKTTDYKDVAFIKNCTTLPLDVHLMVANPNIKKYLKAGANILTVHLESPKYKGKADRLVKDFNIIKKANRLTGLAIKLETPFSNFENLLSEIDILLIMSVNVGESGQLFSGSALSKIKEISKYRQKYNLNFKIEVDGGINPEVAIGLKKSGADIIVSGSYIYSYKDKVKAIKSFAKPDKETSENFIKKSLTILKTK